MIPAECVPGTWVKHRNWKTWGEIVKPGYYQSPKPQYPGASHWVHVRLVPSGFPDELMVRWPLEFLTVVPRPKGVKS